MKITIELNEKEKELLRPMVLTYGSPEAAIRGFMYEQFKLKHHKNAVKAAQALNKPVPLVKGVRPKRSRQLPSS